MTRFSNPDIIDDIEYLFDIVEDHNVSDTSGVLIFFDGDRYPHAGFLQGRVKMDIPCKGRFLTISDGVVLESFVRSLCRKRSAGSPYRAPLLIHNRDGDN